VCPRRGPERSCGQSVCLSKRLFVGRRGSGGGHAFARDAGDTGSPEPGDRGGNGMRNVRSISGPQRDDGRGGGACHEMGPRRELDDEAIELWRTPSGSIPFVNDEAARESLAALAHSNPTDERGEVRGLAVHQHPDSKDFGGGPSHEDERCGGDDDGQRDLPHRNGL